MTFSKIYVGKFCKFVFSYFSELFLTSSFFNTGNSCGIENSKWFNSKWSKWFIFWNICFPCILQIQLTRRNTAIAKKLKNFNTYFSWRRHGMMTKVTFINFFLSRIVPYCKYSICTKVHVKWSSCFLRYSMLFHPGLLASHHPPTL